MVPVFIAHGLVAGFRQIDDREPAMEQRDEQSLFMQSKDLLPRIVRTAMLEDAPAL